MLLLSVALPVCRAVTVSPPALFHPAGMRDHPPIPVTDLADNIDRLKANDGLKFSQEYEVSPGTSRPESGGTSQCRHCARQNPWGDRLEGLVVPHLLDALPVPPGRPCGACQLSRWVSQSQDLPWHGGSSA